jgi:Putative sensor
MNGTITMDATSGSRPRTGNWATRGAVAAGRGTVLFGFTVASLVLWAVLLTAVALIPLGVGLPLTAVALRAMRGLEAKAWRHVADWCGSAAAAPRPAGPARQEEREPSFWVRFGSLMADPDTWRSLQWSTVDILAGWLLTLAPAGLIAWGLFGVVMPAVWHPIVTAHGNNWYAFIHVTSASTAWLSVALGIAFIALGLLAGPWLLRRYGALAQSLLAPIRTA